MSLPRIGFIGLGDQGGPMAQRIVGSGFPTTVWARRSQATVPMIAAGATAAEDPAALAAVSDYIGICVLDDASVVEIFERLRPGLTSGSTVLVHSTVRPMTCRELAGRAQALGVRFLDAPVSGGAAAAKEGRLSVMVGGDRRALDDCWPMLMSFARRIIHVGDVGMGQRSKLVNNLLMAANMAAAHDAVSLGVAMGLDRTTVDEVIASSSAGSVAHSFYAALPDLAAFSRYVGLLRKDLGLIAAESGSDLRVQRLTALAHAFLDKVETAEALTRVGGEASVAANHQA